MQRQFEVNAPVELDLRLASGEIEVEATVSGRVEVELIGHDDESQAMIENARIELLDGISPKVLVDVPQKRGGPEFLDWVGGYFDYETGTAANHWYSKIQTAATTPKNQVAGRSWRRRADSVTAIEAEVISTRTPVA